MLIIDDFSEILALNKLLGRVKFSASLDSEEIEEFASSPLIASVCKKVRDEFAIRLPQERPEYSLPADAMQQQAQANWRRGVLEAIQVRVAEWPEDKVLTVREWDR